MQSADHVTITVLVDNYIDMLMQNSPTITRQGMPEHFLPRRGTPLAENGISFLIKATTAGRTTTILFDAGMSGIPILHNARVLGVNWDDIGSRSNWTPHSCRCPSERLPPEIHQAPGRDAPVLQP
jgi:7,8-dihydropterin-6-yl-methyl-4-(beta-D-ribofuranosyl)aminobenzene 5'-phosphate synthase